MIVETKALLFDMDGVLISSIASAMRCWRRWARHYGVPDPDNIRIAHGTRAFDIVMSLRPDFTEQQALEGLRLIEDMEVEDVGDIVVLPGVRDLLQSLPPERWTIVTSATRRLMVARLNAAGLPWPEQLIAADDVTNGKPHPEPYITGARLLGFMPAECIVVEDAPSGVGAGKAAGSRVLGVLGTHPKDQLRTAGADWIIESIAAVNAQWTDGNLRLSLAV